MKRILGKVTRIPGVRSLWEKFPFGSVVLKTEHGIWNRPHYAYCILSAAKLALSLGINRISVLEFGVAGGTGLVNMEKISKEVEEYFDIKIDVYGFDTGSGMPSPVDYRDLPHVWQSGFYEMEVDKLKENLDRAELVLGDVNETIPSFINRESLAPIGFIAFDLDYYSSTKNAFKIFSGSEGTRLPRVYSYLDDIVYPDYACHNEYVGELCAVKEFNEENEFKKICKLPNLRWMQRHQATWNEQIYIFHDFYHKLYTQLITPEGYHSRQMPLK